jgi:hypothetical protein
VKDARIDAGAALTCTLTNPPYNGFASGIGISASDPDAENYHSSSYFDGTQNFSYLCERAYWVDAANPVRELQLWSAATYSAYIEFDPDFHTYSGFENAAQCGFSHLMTMASDSIDGITVDDGINYHIYNYFAVPATNGQTLINLVVSFSGRVAFVDNAGTGNPFSSGNELWVGVYAHSAWGDNIAVYLEASTYAGFDLGIVGTVDDIGYTLDLVMSDSTVSCPIYHYSSTAYGVPANAGGNNLVLRATKWWQYKRLDGEPQWDENTGEYLPDGTPFMDFSDPDTSMYHPPL